MDIEIIKNFFKELNDLNSNTKAKDFKHILPNKYITIIINAIVNQKDRIVRYYVNCDDAALTPKNTRFTFKNGVPATICFYNGKLDLMIETKSKSIENLQIKSKVFQPIGNGSEAKVKRAVALLSNKYVALTIYKPEENEIQRLLEVIKKSQSVDSNLVIRQYAGTYYKDKNNKTKTITTFSELGSSSLDTILTRCEHYRKSCELQRIDAFLQCVEAVKSLHEANVVHQDLKPENFVHVQQVTTENKTEPLSVKLIDFGIAVNERQGLPEGTLTHVAPEVIYKHIFDKKSTSIYNDRDIMPEYYSDPRYNSLGREILLNNPIIFDGNCLLPSRKQDIFSLAIIFFQVMYARLPKNLQDFNNGVKNYPILKKMISIFPSARPDCERILEEFSTISDKIMQRSETGATWGELKDRLTFSQPESENSTGTLPKNNDEFIKSHLLDISLWDNFYNIEKKEKIENIHDIYNLMSQYAYNQLIKIKESNTIKYNNKKWLYEILKICIHTPNKHMEVLLHVKYHLKLIHSIQEIGKKGNGHNKEALLNELIKIKKNNLQEMMNIYNYLNSPINSFDNNFWQLRKYYNKTDIPHIRICECIQHYCLGAIRILNILHSIFIQENISYQSNIIIILFENYISHQRENLAFNASSQNNMIVQKSPENSAKNCPQPPSIIQLPISTYQNQLNNNKQSTMSKPNL